MKTSTAATGTRAVRRLATATLVAAAVLAGACEPKTTPARPPTSPTPQSAKDALVASVPDGDEGTFRFTIKDYEASGSGVVDAASKGVTASIGYKDPDLGFTMNVAFLVVGQKSWVKITFSNTAGLAGLPKLPNKWLLLDPAKLTDPESTPLTFDGPDPANTAVLLASVVTAKKTGPGQYRGTLDLTKTTDADVADPAGITAMGEAAKAVPFTATVDTSGRLNAIQIQVPAAGKTRAYEYKMTYTGYGNAPKVTAPSAVESQNAPAEAYELLNS